MRKRLGGKPDELGRQHHRPYFFVTQRWIAHTLRISLTALAFAGCGGADKDPSSVAPGDQPGIEAPADEPAPQPSPQEKLRARTGEIAEEARIVCSSAPPKKVAKDFGLTSTDPTVIARRYARGYDEAVRVEVEQACLEGLTNP